MKKFVYLGLIVLMMTLLATACHGRGGRYHCNSTSTVMTTGPG